MKRYIAAMLLALAPVAAHAITTADLHDLGTCTYAVETGRERFQQRIEAMCPENVWYTCQGGTHICCDTGGGTVTIKLQ